ncbi:hypothetical protein [uncultured Tateyamaria sp.]|uniref:hypothetical protein n=1 Tax=uncultured Tateyamaria sp. TaxID=455651 RepID=UPI00260A290A|nr:hypothetical protein [uncultured Tateyamaria sp.]
MTGKPRNARPTPSTRNFDTYLSEIVRPLLHEHYARRQVSVLIDLLRHLEGLRYDYSASRAFQTKPIANAAIAEVMRVTERTVRRWMGQLERLGILTRETRKNPHHRYKNLFNRIRFAGFWGWFSELLAKTPDTECPAKKKDIESISITSKNSGDKSKQAPTFPRNGSIRYDRIWRDIAEKNLPSGRGRPCMDMVAQKFRGNLKQYNLALDDPSIVNRWISFCKRAPIVR